MKRAIALLALLVSGPSLAGLTTTITSGEYVLRNPDNSPIVGLTTYRFQTEAECIAVFKTLKPGRYKCDHSTALASVGTCTDEKAPTLALVKQTIDGQAYWSIPAGIPDPPPAPSAENGWATMIYAYVQNPAPNAYPACWIRGWTPESLWRFNPNYPGTPVMELIVPDMPPIAEAPNSVEPVPVTAADVALYMSTGACEARHVAHVTYDNPAACPDPTTYWQAPTP